MSVITLQRRGLDKPLPHPILDDPSKMMRVIANPVYDKLTLSRAAQIRMHKSPECRQLPTPSTQPQTRSTVAPLKTTNFDETTIMPLPIKPIDANNARSQSNNSSKRKSSLPFRLPSPTPSTRKSPRNLSSPSPSRVGTARSTTQSIQSALAKSTADLKRTVADGTIRYVNSRHGFEVQKYSSRNWLATDVFTKDACQSHEKTFREMLDKKRQYERLARSIYSSEYYTKRWHELLESYEQGYLTHAEWAKQNYQLLCIRTLYSQAKNREQRAIELDAEDVRQRHARNAFHHWKESKDKDYLDSHRSRITTAQSQHHTDGPSFLSNSFSIPLSTTIDDNNTTIPDTDPRISLSMSLDSDAQATSVHQPVITTKKPSATEKALFLLDEQRWSLQAMLKRVVGLAEPLPPPPKVKHRKQSPVTNASNDSGFESVI